MRRVSSAARQLKIHFIRNPHRWVDISKQSEYIKMQCQDCGLIAMQEKGSLELFVVEGDANIAYLSCDELIIKNLIE